MPAQRRKRPSSGNGLLPLAKSLPLPNPEVVVVEIFRIDHIGGVVVDLLFDVNSCRAGVG